MCICIPWDVVGGKVLVLFAIYFGYYILTQKSNMVFVILTEALSEYGHKDVCDITPAEIAAQVTCGGSGGLVCVHISQCAIFYICIFEIKE